MNTEGDIKIAHDLVVKSQRITAYRRVSRNISAPSSASEKKNFQGMCGMLKLYRPVQWEDGRNASILVSASAKRDKLLFGYKQENSVEQNIRYNLESNEREQIQSNYRRHCESNICITTQTQLGDKVFKVNINRMHSLIFLYISSSFAAFLSQL